MKTDLRALLKHPTIRFLIAALAVAAAYVGHGHVTGPARIAPSLQERLDRAPATVNILVTTPFAPEEFHIRLYQQLGNMRGVEGRTAKLYSVTPPNVRFLSRHYWIQRLDLAPDS